MKKITFIISFLLIISFSCNNHSTINNGNGAENNIESPSPELIEMAEKYHINIDTTKTYDMNIKVLQTLGDEECLANELSNKQYGWYHGTTLYYYTSNMVYDDKIITEKAYLVGTYKYTTRNLEGKVVPFYCEVNTYKKLAKEGFFDNILKIQTYSR